MRAASWMDAGRCTHRTNTAGEQALRVSAAGDSPRGGSKKIPRFRICCKTTSSSRLLQPTELIAAFVATGGSYCDRDSLSVLFAASIAFTIPSVQQRPGRNTIALGDETTRAYSAAMGGGRTRKTKSPHIMSHDIFSTIAP